MDVAHHSVFVPVCFLFTTGVVNIRKELFGVSADLDIDPVILFEIFPYVLGDNTDNLILFVSFEGEV